MWNGINGVGYHKFKRPDSDEDYGSFEVFEHRPSVPFPGDDEPFEHGFYWRSCFPGCLPDSDTCFGPFPTAQDAFNDAQGDL